MPGLKIISVGNLSVGGTGKTVFIQFLTNFLGVKNCAVVSRGYKSKSAVSNLLVYDGRNVKCTPSICGDEPYMLAMSTGVVTVVGRDRLKSCVIAKNAVVNLKYILLDDAYQNVQLKKDIEILIIDARFPLGFNGHCLPAGNLRESNYLRADLIIVSHADAITHTCMLNLPSKFFPKFDAKKILFGKHRAVGLFQSGEKEVQHEFLEDKKFLVAGGIGSFSGFVEGVKNFGVQVLSTVEFEDHYTYSIADIDMLIKKLNAEKLSGIIVTQKDWVKLSQIIQACDISKFFVFRIEFEFLSHSQYSLFSNFLSSKLSQDSVES